MAGKKKKSNKITNNSTINPDIILLIVLAISVLLFISTLGLCGIVGVGVRLCLFGLFGTVGYAVAFILFFTFAYVMANKDNKAALGMFIAFAAMFALVCALFQLVLVGYDPYYTLYNCFMDSAAYHMGGGLLGGAIVKLLGTVIGVIGAYIIIIILMIICAIIITQKPLISNMKKSTKKAYGKAKSKIRQNEEDRVKEPAYKEPLDIEEKEFIPKSDTETDIFDRYLKNRSKEAKEPEVFINSFSKDEPQKAFSVEDELTEINDGESYDASEPSSPEEMRQIKPKKKSVSKRLPEVESPKENEKPDIKKPVKPAAEYKAPPLKFLNRGKSGNKSEIESHTKQTARKLQQTLDDFGVNAKVISASCGPTVTRYELKPEQGVKVSRIVGLSDDIKLALAAADIRIEAPIPGKSAVGIEVPNKTNVGVTFRELLESDEYKNSRSDLTFAVGKDLSGKTVVTDISKMPHLLIAGATGSGKSVCINTLIMSILYKSSPETVRFLMVDPKVVELSVYNGIPHLLSPVVTDPKKAAGTLQWAVAEMTRRYNAFAEFHVKDISSYNKKAESIAGYANEEEEIPQKMPKIVIVVDELAELMMAAPGEVEEAICRLAQLARAAGIHLVIATQRPSVNVITGLIKANMPSRIALSVTSGTDSRVILDMNGAEKLLGKGDMLFYPAGYQKPARVQGAYISEDEIQNIVQYLKDTNIQEIVYEEALQNVTVQSSSSSAGISGESDVDVLFADAGRFIIEKDKASIGMLQRVFKIGFNRAARIMDQLCEAGVVGEEEGTKPRKILMSMEQFENYLEMN